jgi:alpha-D-ribose 1-methylphosphonate 5-triphosphate synthase subunit PhnH
VRLLSNQVGLGQVGCELRVSGPGVKALNRLSVVGLDARYLEERSKANRFYPMGIDLLFVDAEGRVAGVPRTSALETG